MAERVGVGLQGLSSLGFQFHQTLNDVTEHLAPADGVQLCDGFLKRKWRDAVLRLQRGDKQGFLCVGFGSSSKLIVLYEAYAAVAATLVSLSRIWAQMSIPVVASLSSSRRSIVLAILFEAAACSYPRMDASVSAFALSGYGRHIT